jgi:phage terminase large subunit-like protein
MTKAFELTPKQRAVALLLKGPERHNLVYGGSRSGKTFLLCYAILSRALEAPGSRHLVARLHNIDVRQSVMLDTWPKVCEARFPDLPYRINKTDQFVTIGEGSEVWFGGLDDKERVDKILGKEYATIYVNEASQVSFETILTLRTRLAQNVARKGGGQLPLKAYYDLNPTGMGHWSYREFVAGVRPDNDQAIDPGTRAYAVMNPTENPYLPKEYLEELAALPERQRKRFLEGSYLSEVPGALWPLDMIERSRVDEIPKLSRIVVGVDPSGSDGVGGDTQGIVVAGMGADGHVYVLEDCSVRLSPQGWARAVVDAYHKWGADCVVAEVNYGGAMVEAVIRAADPNLRFKAVTAARGKHIRAEPVSALYEQGKAHHVGRFPKLEDQMGMFTTAGFQGGSSPDRADAMVWAITELAVKGVSHSGLFEFYRRQAEDRHKG